MPTSHLPEKMQSAIARLITLSFAPGAPPCHIFTGLDSREQDRPCAICHATDAEEYPPHSGNYNVNCTVTVASNANPDNDGNEARTPHENLTGQIFDTLNTFSLASDLNNTALDIHVLGIYDRGLDSGILADNFVSTFSFKAYAASVAISAA